VNGPIPDELQTTNPCPGQILLQLFEPSATESSALARVASAEASKRGLPFRIPAMVKFRVFSQSTTNVPAQIMLTGEMLLAQWGVISQLPPNIGSPGSTFKPVYYTETGALKELTVTGTPLSPDSLDSLGKATGSITDALKARADREASAAKDKAAQGDELYQLKREGDILEEQLRIQQLREKLPLSGSNDNP
jgi:hypothetical protein